MTFIPTDELEHILSQFSHKNMSSDMAMFFITQNIDMDDIYMFDYIVDVQFYKDVWAYIWKWTETRIKNKRLDTVISDIVIKLKCDRYSNDLYINNRINRDYFVTGYIEALVVLLDNNGKTDDLNLVVDTLYTVDAIDKSVMTDVILNNIQAFNNTSISSLIMYEHLPVEDMLAVLMEKYQYTSNRDIKQYILDVFFNKELLMKLLVVIRGQYYMNIDENEIELEFIELNMPDEYKEALDFIRCFVCELIYIDAEMMFYEFLEDKWITYLNIKDMVRADVYKTYLTWFNNDIRHEYALGQYIANGYEECNEEFEFDDLEWAEISEDSQLIQYMSETPAMNEYDIFIRLFNINRFRLFQERHEQFIVNIIRGCVDYAPLSVELGLNDDIYIFIRLFQQ